MTSGGSAAPAPSETARAVYAGELAKAAVFADLLASSAVQRGLIGPREVSSIWDRHLVNCALIADVLPPDARIVDVGSGAGLPGLALAIRRPDLSVDLVEPLLRRVTFLTEAVAALELGDRVRVVRGRADSSEVIDQVGGARWITARAVAPLGRLVRWSLPLLERGGMLLALKGARADEEIVAARHDLATAGGFVVRVTELGAGAEVARVVCVRRDAGESARAGGR